MYKSNLVQRKIEILKSGDFDTIFFGTSRIYRSIVPSIIDEKTGWKTFNFGLPSASVLEVLYLIQNLAKTKRTFVELWNPREVPPGHPPGHPRLAYWHEARDLPELFYRVRHSKRAIRFHGVCFLARGLVEEGDKFKMPENDSAGYVPLEEECDFEIISRRMKFLMGLEAYTRRISEASNSGDTATPWQAQILKKIVSLSPSVEFIVTPVLRKPDHLVEVCPGKVHRFDNPEQYPCLYAPESRFDKYHLNEAGAILFSELIASSISHGQQKRSTI